MAWNYQSSIGCNVKENLMQNFSSSPLEIFASFWRNRQLIQALVMREFLGRYRGSLFGVLWSFFNPVLLLVIYTFVFGVVFRARWGSEEGSRIEFALALFAGLIPFNLFAECFSRAFSLILVNPNYVKKVVFPLEILPWVVMGSALLHAFISFAVWLVVYMFLVGFPPHSIIVFPILLLPFIFFIMGITWMMASLGVYFRDLGQINSLIITTLMFLSPVFYPITALPSWIQVYAYLNPLTWPIEQIRQTLWHGNFPALNPFIAYSIFSLLIAGLGFSWFQKSRKGFSDVL
jgi:lipopolysaccharide transport system permease protein